MTIIKENNCFNSTGRMLSVCTRRMLLTLLTLGALLCSIAHDIFNTDVVAFGTRPYRESDLEWRNIDVDGHRAAVFCIYTDSRGLILVGTSQGLFLYDGAETHRVGGSDLTGVHVYSIVEHEDCLFLGSNHGLMVYQCKTGRIDASLSDPSMGEIRSMLTSDNKLLIGSLNGLFAYDYSSKKKMDMSKGLPHRSVYSLLRDSRGILYAGTTGGLARYDVSTSRFYPVESEMLHSNSQRTFVNCMLEAPDRQTIYIGTGDGLFSYRPAQERWNHIEPLSHVMVKSLATNRDGHLLVGTYDGLFHLAPNAIHLYQRDTRKPTSPAGNQIWTVMEDAEGNVWTGHERGISIASNSAYFRSLKIGSLVSTGESNEFLTMFRDTRGDLWLGGTNGVIVRKADGTAQWHHLADADDTTGNICVRSVMEDSHGTVWLSTDGGIFRYNAATGTFSKFLLSDAKGDRVCNWVYAVRQMGEDLWVASYLGGVNRIGLSKLSGNSGAVKADFSLERGKVMENDNISHMVADDKGCLWVLLYGSQYLYRYHTDTKKADRYDMLQMAGAVPTYICIDRKGRLWCAYKGGVMVFDSDGKTTNISLPSSGSDESVLTMAAVDDGVWVSTMSNLWSIDGSRLSPMLIPVPQKGYTAIWDDIPSGKVIVGALDEVLEVNKIPMNEVQNMGQIRMALQCVNGQVKNLNNLIDQSDAFFIPYGGSLSLIVSTLNYSPDIVPHLQYRVVKRGSDDAEGKWVVMPEGVSTINLTDMSFGDYEIQVKVVSNPLPPAVIPLKVGKPFWLSWWAFVLYFLFVAAVAGAIIWYQRRRAMRRAQEREREETLANVEQKMAFLSVEKQDLETRIEQLLKASEEMTAHQRHQAITDAKPIEIESPIEKQLAGIAQIVEENISSLDLNGAFIGEQCGVSEKQLYRTLKKHLGVTPSEYIRNVRMQKAAMLLSQNYFTVSEVAYMVGFSAPSYFSKCFQDHYGVAPSAYHPNDQKTNAPNDQTSDK